MKTKIKHFSKCALSAVLAAIMILSTTLVGSVDTISAAETTETQSQTISQQTAEQAEEAGQTANDIEENEDAAEAVKSAVPEKKALEASGGTGENWYLGGRCDGSSTYRTTSDNNYKFTESSDTSGLYYFNTQHPISWWYNGGLNNAQSTRNFIFIKDANTLMGSSDSGNGSTKRWGVTLSYENGTDSKQLGGNISLCFVATSTSEQNVIFWINTNGTSPTFYYTLERDDTTTYYYYNYDNNLTPTTVYTGTSSSSLTALDSSKVVQDTTDNKLYTITVPGDHTYIKFSNGTTDTAAVELSGNEGKYFVPGTTNTNGVRVGSWQMEIPTANRWCIKGRFSATTQMNSNYWDDSNSVSGLTFSFDANEGIYKYEPGVTISVIEAKSSGSYFYFGHYVDSSTFENFKNNSNNSTYSSGSNYYCSGDDAGTSINLSTSYTKNVSFNKIGSSYGTYTPTLFINYKTSTPEFYYTIEGEDVGDTHPVYFYNILGWTNVKGIYTKGGTTTSLTATAATNIGANWYKVDVPDTAASSDKIYFSGVRTEGISGMKIRTEEYECPTSSSTDIYFVPMYYTYYTSKTSNGPQRVACYKQTNSSDEITLDSTKNYIYLRKNSFINNWTNIFAHIYKANDSTVKGTTWHGYRFRKVSGYSDLYAIEAFNDSTFNFANCNRIVVADGKDDAHAYDSSTDQKKHRFLTYTLSINNVFTPLDSFSKNDTLDGSTTIYRREAEWRDFEANLYPVDTGKARIYAKTGTVRLDGGDEFDKYSRLADVKIAFKNTNSSTSVQTAYTVDGSKEQVNVGSTTSTNRELLGVYYKRSAYYDTQETPGKHYRKIIADADKTENVTITVTLRTDTTNNLIDRYYVKAFVINGNTVKTFTYNSNGTYSYTFKPSDINSNYIEVTPVYYYNESSSHNTISGGTSKYITLQVDDYDKVVNNSSVKAIWGNTLAVYSWYNPSINRSTSVAGAADGTNVPALGGYPGQPMIYVNGHYEMQIPRYLNGNISNTVKGITLNNYTWDDAHTEIVDMMKAQNETNLNAFAGTQAVTVTSKNERNCQTYDYDDFVALSELDAAKIRFTFKYRTYNSTGKNPELENTAANSGNFANGTVLTGSANSLSFVTGTGGNGWEALMDDENIPVDLFDRKVLYNDDYQALDTGNNLTNTNYLTQAFVETLPNKAANVYNDLVYVVSDGYENYYEYNRDANDNSKKTGDPVNEYIGEYATRWYVYKRNSSDGKFNFLGALPPSAFLSDAIKADESLDSSKYLNYSTTAQKYKIPNRSYINSGKADYDTYQSLYNACKGLPVVIAYESSLYSEGRQQAVSNRGNRSDGRWTYSPESPTVQAKVKIQIVTEDSNGNLLKTTTDAFDSTTIYQGTTTKANAYFTNSEFNKTVDSGTVIKNPAKNFNLTASPYAVNGDKVYVFAGWYSINELKDTPSISTDTYTHVNTGSSLLSTTGSVPMNSDYTFIAAYKEAAGKQIIFSHQLYSVADTSNITTYRGTSITSNPIPAVHNGTGKTEIKIEVYKNGTKQTINGLPDVYTEAPVTLTTVNFPDGLSSGSVSSEYTFKVCLRTTPDTDNTLQKMLKIPGTSGTDLGLITETASTTVTTQEYTLTAAQINALFGSGTIASVRNYSDLSSNNVSIRFNYYDRAVYSGAVAEDISKTPTSLTVDQTRDTTGATGTAILENTVTIAMETNKITTENDANSSISSVLDNYCFWPTQTAAKNAVAQRTNLRTGQPYGNTDVEKHFDYYGFTSTESVAASDNAPAHNYSGNHAGYAENWVTYYDAAKNVVSAANANSDPLQVASIEVWGLNVPKEYTVYFKYPKNADQAAAGTGYTEITNFKGYYNERVGREYKDDAVDGLSSYLKNYGVKLSTRNRFDITAPASFEKTVDETTTYYYFDGWLDESGVKVSTDRTYANRITGSMTLTAHYTSQTINLKPDVENSVTVTSNGVENYISDKNVERVRLLTQINVNGYQNELTGQSDQSINQMAIIYVKLPSSANPTAWTSEQKSAIYTSIQTAVQDSLTKAMVSNTNPTGVSVFTVTMTDITINSLNLGRDQNTIAYTYDVVWNDTDYNGETNGTEITLTNKNRIQFSLDLKKSSVLEGGSNSNIIAVAAIKADRDGINADDNTWIVSQDGVVYYYDSNTTSTKTLIISSGSTGGAVSTQEEVDVIPVSANIENLQIFSVSDNAPTQNN